MNLEGYNSVVESRGMEKKNLVYVEEESEDLGMRGK